MQAVINLNYFAEKQKNLTISIAAWLIAYFPDSKSWNYDQLQSFNAAILAACKQNTLDLKPIIKTNKKDSNIFGRIELFPAVDKVVRIYTDYDLAKELINMPDFFQIVNNEEDADFLLTMAHMRDFVSLPLQRRVCQFPFEAGLIRKVSVYHNIFISTQLF
jgi:hypothetical protein